MDFPNSFKQLPPSDRTTHPRVFDPALKHFTCAFRHGEPSFVDFVLASNWRAARHRLWYSILDAISNSWWKDNLVLRGSLLLKHWFGDVARNPGDADWIVRPASISIRDSWTKDLFADLERFATSGYLTKATGVKIDDVRTDEIWTYDRVPGRRIVYYWHEGTSEPGCLQLDFVFGEEMWAPPVKTALELGFDKPITLWTADKELSLAWKLLWLDNDMYPQGKDLYDAVLLAESVKLPPHLLKFAPADRITRRGMANLKQQFAVDWHVDWVEFQSEYPLVTGGVWDWIGRLCKALDRVFDELENE